MSLYLWVKATHLIFVVALMAGLLIFPRYKLHQIKSAPGEPLFETMREASDRLRRIILNPSLILVWVLGIWMIVLNQSLLSAGWMHTKLLLVVILSGLYGYFISIGKKIDKGALGPSTRTLKMLNEVPFVIMIAVILLAVLKPF
ncbi:MAG: CopD family protein [Pseudomonadota bacterium]